MKKALNILAGIIGAFVGYWVVQSVFFSDSIPDALAKAANQINKQAPIMVDANTRLDNAAAGLDKITYFYTIVGLEDDQVIESQGEIERVVRAKVKEGPEFRQFRDRGIDMCYIYRNQSGQELLQFTIDH